MFLTKILDNKILKLSNKRLLTFGCVFVFVFLLAPKTHASWFGIDNFAAGAVTSLVGYFLLIAQSAVIELIRLLSNGTTSVLGMRIDNVPVVNTSWTLIRDFANMFFILALIIMAFGTIFSISKYDFRTMIVRFLIAALLINFSLVIGEIIINWSQALSNVFITAIGSIGDKIGQAGDFSQRMQGVTGIPGGGPDAVGFSNSVALIMNIGLLSIVLFSMAILFIFSLIRIPFLWVLLIVSPIAWVTYILPTTQDINRKWWKYFIGWNVFMPMYLFFIYFGVLFIQNIPTITASVNVGGGSTLGIAFQDLFIYILVAIFLIGGAKVAMSSSMSAGAGGVAGAIWAKGRATARYTGVGLSRRIPVINQLEPAYKAAGQRITQFSKDSQEALEKRQDKMAGMFGVKGVDDKRFMKDIEEASNKMKNKKEYNDKNRLTTYLEQGTPAQKIAASKLLKEFHDLDLNKEQLQSLGNTYKDRGMVAEGSKFFASVDYSKMSANDLREILADPAKYGVNASYIAQFKSRIADALIKKPIRDVSDYKGILSNYTKEEDMIDAIKRTDKDLLDSFSKGENLELIEFLNGKRGAQKLIAEKALKKGHIGPDLMKQLFADKKNGGLYDSEFGLYDSKFERDRALKVAEERRLMSTMELREQLGIFDTEEYVDTDGATKTRNKTIEAMLQDRVDRLGNEEINRQSLDNEELGNQQKQAKFLAALDTMLMRDQKRGVRRLNAMKGDIKNWTGKHDIIYAPLLTKYMQDAKTRRENEDVDDDNNDDDNNDDDGSGSNPPTSPKPRGPKGGGGGSSGGGTPPLGPGEKITKGGVILTPGARYQMERPRLQTPPPTESGSRVSGTVPFSSATGTIKSGEIGRPSEPEDGDPTRQNLARLRKVQLLEPIDKAIQEKKASYQKLDKGLKSELNLRVMKNLQKEIEELEIKRDALLSSGPNILARPREEGK